MNSTTRLPVALTIAGSDSGGGAGIQMDLKVFSALGVFGTSAITALTAQNPQRISRIQVVSPALLSAQLRAVFEGFDVKAAKTGMLGTAATVKAVAAMARTRGGKLKLVVDPILRASSGIKLLDTGARRVLETELLPLATLVTPNLNEAVAFLGRELPMREAAATLAQQWGVAVLLKGGHAKDAVRVVDIFHDGRQAVELAEPRVRGVRIHGLGCATSAAITAFLAQGCPLLESVMLAKKFITRAIRGSARAGRYRVLRF